MNRIQRLEKILNGGPNSGNHNPGQGRGIGKPSNKISSFGVEFDENGHPKYSYEQQQEAERKFDDLSDDLLMSDEQEQLLKRNYFGNSNYRFVQEYKKARDREEREDIRETFGDEIAETVEELDFLFDASSLSDDATLYRGIFADDDEFEKIKNSDSFSYNGYSSTSMSPTETCWKRNQGNDGRNNFILVKINAKKGSQGIKNPRKEDNETEVLLPADAVMNRKRTSETIDFDGSNKMCIIEVDYE